MRSSQRLQIQDKEFEKLKMLYMQVASEKTAMHRDKQKLQEKLDKKRIKNDMLKQELEDKTLNLQRKHNENAQLGQIISQVL